MHTQNCVQDNKCRFVFLCIFIIIGGIGYFQEGLCVIHDGWAYTWWYRCMFGTLEHEVAWRRFPIHIVTHEILHGSGHFPSDSYLVEEVPEFKAFIKSYNVDGKDLLVEYTESQSFWFYMRDGDLLAMQYNFLCTTLNQNSLEGILIWEKKMNITKQCCLVASLNLANQILQTMRKRLSRGFMDSSNTRKEVCMKKTTPKLCVDNMDDWYHIGKVCFLIQEIPHMKLPVR